MATVVHCARHRGRNCTELPRTHPQDPVDRRLRHCPDTSLRGQQEVDEFRIELSTQPRYEQRTGRARHPHFFERNGAFVRGRGIADDRRVSQQSRHQGNRAFHTRRTAFPLVIFGTPLPVPVVARTQVQRVHRHQVQTCRCRPQTRLLPACGAVVTEIESPIVSVHRQTLCLHEHPVGGVCVHPPPDPVGATGGLRGLSERNDIHGGSGTGHHDLGDSRFTPPQKRSLTGRHVLHGMLSRPPERRLHRRHGRIFAYAIGRASGMSQMSSRSIDRFQSEVAPRRRMVMPDSRAEGSLWFRSAS
ncbi:Uncharacterised protein [Mycobacteroides abscessus]|nr:Uncharacterised protein [Mycobacteroides abscessus]